jgi:hypothetical protein
MLSFMREQNAGRTQENPAAGQAAQSTNPGSKEENQDYLKVATDKSRVQKSTILVAILIGLGLVCLWFMIHKSRPQAAVAQPSKDEQTQMEATISRLTGISSEMLSRMDEIVKKFYEFSDVAQVGVNELVKNPFEIETFMDALKDEAIAEQDDAAKMYLMQRQRLKERAASLKLLSVIRSDQKNVCMINDQLLCEGDCIEGFTVTKIGSDFVRLLWSSSGRADGASDEGDLTFELKLAQ